MIARAGRIFAVGDIHGCVDKLRTLLGMIKLDWDRDLMVFLGDYVDRGPDSRGVIELLLDLKKRHADRLIFLKGNHEWMFMQFLKGEDHDFFLQNGGIETLESYSLEKGKTDMPQSHLDFLDNLDLYFETQDYIFVHAGLRSNIPISEQSQEDLLWIRSPFLKSSYDWGKRVIFGHTPFSVPLIEANKVGIDTGAVYGGRLTCLILPDFEFIFS
nr:serine/threonine protein phosphatase [Deltaproteobacteria bacterium]